MSIQALRFLLAILGRVHGASPYSNGSQRQVYSGTDPTIAFIGPMRQQSQQSTDVTYCRDERFQQQVDMA